MQFRFYKGKFYARCSFEERHVLKSAGFRFDESKKVFYTPSYSVAARLRPLVDDLTKREIDRKIIHQEPWAEPLPFPQAETPKSYQIDSAIFSLSRNRSYLGLDPGLGKTIVAVMVANALAKKAPTLFVYVCPPFLTRNVQEEFKRWKTFEASARRYNFEDPIEADFLIVPDSLIARPDHKEEINWLLAKAREAGKKIVYFVDEAHRFKNGDTERTKALLGFSRKSPKTGRLQHVKGFLCSADRIIYMSGTPMPNRPMELFSILSHSAPETIDFMSRFDYGIKYCGGYDTGFGYDFNGGSAEDVARLAKKVFGKFMLRLKKNVLKDLPAKLEEMLVVAEDMPARLAALDRGILSKLSPGQDVLEAAMRQMAEARGELKEGDELHMATYRRMLGLAKVPAAIEAAKASLEESEDALILFAFHTEVIEKLREGLKKFNPLVITGATPMDERHNIVKAFQTEPARRLIIANYLAAGVGLTLTKARRVDFCEWDWVPGVNDQASDRAHRIGQTADVYVRYLVFANSLDKRILESNLRKRQIINKL